MATIASKRKLNTKSIKDKYQALKEVKEGKSKLQVAAKYGIPKSTLSTWIKNKDKIFEAVKKGMNTKRQRLRAGSYEKLDQVIFKGLLTVRSRDVAVSALILKTKAIDFAEKMSTENFHASDGWLDRWKRCVGGKHSKLRLTGLAATNAAEEKLLMFFIGKSKSPRFKNIKHLPCRYCSQNKSWMESILFEEWVREIDRRFTAEGKKNCSSG